MNLRLFSLIICCALVVDPADAQIDLGAGVQVYPAGVILGARAGKQFGERSLAELHLGFNIANRGDYGEADNEEGDGPGFGFGYARYLRSDFSGVFFGGRLDLWFLDIAWRLDRDPDVTGRSEITVLQPTARAGYGWNFLSGSVRVELSIAFGAEINIRTKGAAVGQGAILLGGAGFVFRP